MLVQKKNDPFFESLSEQWNIKAKELELNKAILSDPHFYSFSQAFLAIGSTLQATLNGLMSNQLESIKYNYFNTFIKINSGILQAKPMKKCKIPAGYNFYSTNSIFRTKYNHNLLPIELNSINCFFHEKLQTNFLSLSIHVEELDFDKIEILVNSKLWNNIDWEQQSWLENRKLYRTKCKHHYNTDYSVEELHTEWYPLVIENINNISLIDESLEILIPLIEKTEINHSNILLNTIFIENKFITEINLIEEEENNYELKIDGNLLFIKEVKIDEKIIPPLIKDDNGWYLNRENNRYIINMGFNGKLHYAQVEITNKELDFFELTPESFQPAEFSLIKETGSYEENGLKDFKNLVSLQRPSLGQLVTRLQKYTNIYLNITAEETSNKLELLPREGYVIAMEINSITVETKCKDRFLLYQLAKELSNYYDHLEIKFIPLNVTWSSLTPDKLKSYNL